MTLNTVNLDSAPFFDDFDETKNYHQVLWRPSYPVQARELTQVQDILQNQIQRFGDNIYVDGTVIKGCNFSTDATLKYVKVPDLFDNNENLNVGMVNGLYLWSAITGLGATVVDVLSGYSSQDATANGNMNTLFVKYLNSGNNQSTSFSPGESIIVTDPVTNNQYSSLSFHIANSSYMGYGNTNGPTGSSYQFKIGDGVIYKNGYFVRVPNQSVVVSSYTNIPDGVTVGLTLNENVVNNSIDTSLNSNATGYPNDKAPGAWRLQLTPSLLVVPTSNSYSNNFLSLMTWVGGNVTQEHQDTQFNSVEKEMARRMNDEAGSFVTNAFSVSVTDMVYSNGAVNSNNVVFSLGSGSCYIDGYQVNLPSGTSISLPKGLDIKQQNNSVVSTPVGNYVLAQELAGPFVSGSVINLRDTAGSYITNLAHGNTTFAPGNTIGTATLISIAYDSGDTSANTAQYRAYLSNIQMNSGSNFGAVRSIGSNTAIADLIVANNTATIYNSSQAQLIYSYGHAGINAVSSNSTSYYFKATANNVALYANGVATFTIPGSSNYFPYSSGSLTSAQISSDLIAIPSTTLLATDSTFSGTVSTNSASTLVGVGSANVISNFSVGDYISFGNTAVMTGIRKVVQINFSNNTIVVDYAPATTNTVSSYTKAFPVNIPVPFSTLRGDTVNVSNNSQSISINLGHTLSGTANLSLSYTGQANNSNALTKTVNRQAYIYIDTTTAGTNGPWSLGVPDAFNLVAVYKDSANATISSTNVTSAFIIDSNQKDAFYGTSLLRKSPTSSIAVNAGDKLLVCFDYFSVQSGATGFFNVSSYPVNDTLAANNSSYIYTAQIPVYTSSITGSSFDLRNCVDFRPYVSATVTPVSNSALAANSALNPTISYTLPTNVQFPQPNKSVTSSFSYNLGRIDLIAMDTSGNIVRIAGTPSENPVTPTSTSLSGSQMAIATVSIPPYPSLSPASAANYNRYDYIVSASPVEQRAWRMKDISGLEKRITALEYYAALSLLEQNTTNLVIPSSVTGQNRFKNGVFVDPLSDFTISNVNDGEYTAALDPSDYAPLMPPFNQTAIPLVANTAGSNNVFIGNNSYSIAFSESTLISQIYATRYFNCTEGLFNFVGTAFVYPVQDIYYDTRTSLIAISNVTPTIVATVSVANTSSQYPVLQSSNTYSSNTSNSGLFTAGTSVLNSSEYLNNSNGYITPIANFATDGRLTSYIRPQRLRIGAIGMRPTTPMHVYFAGQKVDYYCTPASLPASANGNLSQLVEAGIKNQPMFSDANGNFYCMLDIQAGTFYTGNTAIAISDVDLATSNTAATTTATTNFYAFNDIDPPSLSITTANTNILISSSSSVTDDYIHHYWDVSTSSTYTYFQCITGITTTVDGVVVAQNTYGMGTVTDSSYNRYAYDTNGYGYGADPIAQSFSISSAMAANNSGLYVSSVDVYFRSADVNAGVTLAICGLSNGVPNYNIAQMGSKHLFPVSTYQTYNYSNTVIIAAPSGSKANTSSTSTANGVTTTVAYLYSPANTSGNSFWSGWSGSANTLVKATTTTYATTAKQIANTSPIQISGDGSVATRFTFDDPVYLAANSSYAFVVAPDSSNPNYTIWGATVGEVDISSNTTVNQTWTNGEVFTSTNGTTWNPLSGESLKFNLNIASFGTALSNTTVNAVGYVNLTNPDDEYFTVSNTSGSFSHGHWAFQNTAYQNTSLQISSSNNILIANNSSYNTLSVGQRIIVTDTNGNYDCLKVTSLNSSNAVANLYSNTSLSSNLFFTVDKMPSFSNNSGNSTVFSVRYSIPPMGIVDVVNFANAYIALANSTANSTNYFTSNSTLIDVATGGSAIISSINNIVVNRFQPLFYTDTVTGSSIYTYYTGTDSSYNGITPTAIDLTATNYINNKNMIVASKTNEILNLGGSKSLSVNAIMSTTTAYITPQFLGTQGLVTYNNIINANTTNENTKLGSALARYVSVNTVLADGQDAEDLIVYIDAYKPQGTAINVYAKILNATDPDSFDSKDWTLLSQTSNTQLYSSSSNRNDVYEFQYGFSNTASSNNAAFLNQTNSGIVRYVSSSNVVYDTYKKFAIKVDLLSSTSYLVPRVKDIRALALSV